MSIEICCGGSQNTELKLCQNMSISVMIRLTTYTGFEYFQLFCSSEAHFILQFSSLLLPAVSINKHSRSSLHIN